MELDLQSLFEFHVHSCTHLLRPHIPPPPRIWAHIPRALLVSQDRRHLSVWPSGSTCISFCGMDPPHGPVIAWKCTSSQDPSFGQEYACMFDIVYRTVVHGVGDGMESIVRKCPPWDLAMSPWKNRPSMRVRVRTKKIPKIWALTWGFNTVFRSRQDLVLP